MSDYWTRPIRDARSSLDYGHTQLEADDCPVWLDWVVRVVAVAAIGFAVWMAVS